MPSLLQRVIQKNAQLNTLNIKHYPMIENLKAAYSKN